MALPDGAPEVTRPAEHVTPQMLLQRCDSPLLLAATRCAITRGHLREITSSDVDAVLEPLRGHRRYNAITALRSLFRFARRRA